MIAQVQVHALPTHSISRNYFLFFSLPSVGVSCVWKLLVFPSKKTWLSHETEGILFCFFFFDSSSKELEEQKDNKKKRVNYLFAQFAYQLLLSSSSESNGIRDCWKSRQASKNWMPINYPFTSVSGCAGQQKLEHVPNVQKNVIFDWVFSVERWPTKEMKSKVPRHFPLCCVDTVRLVWQIGRETGQRQTMTSTARSLMRAIPSATRVHAFYSHFQQTVIIEFHLASFFLSLSLFIKKKIRSKS